MKKHPQNCGCFYLCILNCLNHVDHYIRVDSFHQAVVVALGHMGVDGQTGQDGQVELDSNLVQVGLAEDVDLLAAVGALQIAVVLHEAQHRNMHHIGHLHSLGNDHRHQVLGAGDDHNTCSPSLPRCFKRGNEYEKMDKNTFVFLYLLADVSSNVGFRHHFLTTFLDCLV